MIWRRAEHPFKFFTQWSSVELTGLAARDLVELLNHLTTVPGSVIYYHTHHFLRQHQHLSPEPPNDFAYWVTQILNVDRLGEQLAAIDTVRFASLRALREKLMEVIRNYLSGDRASPVAPEGEEFHFMKSRSFVVQTPYVASDLPEFVEAVQKVSIFSLYHHIFEARLRLERGANDFSNWLEAELGEKELAVAVARLDPYTQTLEALRSRIVRLAQTRIQRHMKGAPHAS